MHNHKHESSRMMSVLVGGKKGGGSDHKPKSVMLVVTMLAL